MTAQGSYENRSLIGAGSRENRKIFGSWKYRQLFEEVYYEETKGKGAVVMIFMFYQTTVKIPNWWKQSQK